jgi:hypothetical protein
MGDAVFPDSHESKRLNRRDFEMTLGEMIRAGRLWRGVALYCSPLLDFGISEVQVEEENGSSCEQLSACTACLFRDPFHAMVVAMQPQMRIKQK